LSGIAFALPRSVDFQGFDGTRCAGEAHVDEQTDEALFDLSTLEEYNSAAVALLMAWLRYAHAQGKSVVYAGAPAELLNLIDVGGLSGTLPVQP
jgi:ABC-type transporter Mla MlaB component